MFALLWESKQVFQSLECQKFTSYLLHHVVSVVSNY